MTFELRTEIQKDTKMYEGDNEDLLVFYMRVNSNDDNDWWHCPNLLSMFKDKRSAWLALKPTIITLLNKCYDEPKVILT